MNWLRRALADMSQVVVRGTVFARFSPEQKQQLVESLQDVGWVVVVVVVVVVHLYSASRSASNALIVPQRCEEMSL